MGTTSGPARLAVALAALPLLLFGAGTATADEMNPMPPPEPVGPIQGELDAEFDQIIDDAAQAQLEADVAAEIGVLEGAMEDSANGLFLIPQGTPVPPHCSPAPTVSGHDTIYFFCGGPMPGTNPPIFMPGIGEP